MASRGTTRKQVKKTSIHDLIPPVKSGGKTYVVCDFENITARQISELLKLVHKVFPNGLNGDVDLAQVVDSLISEGLIGQFLGLAFVEKGRKFNPATAADVAEAVGDTTLVQMVALGKYYSSSVSAISKVDFLTSSDRAAA